jgi:hypothetical protein
MAGLYLSNRGKARYLWLSFFDLDGLHVDQSLDLPDEHLGRPVSFQHGLHGHRRAVSRRSRLERGDVPTAATENADEAFQISLCAS